MTSISVAGGSSLYIRQALGIQYSTDQLLWTSVLSFPITVSNSSPGSGVVTVIFTTDLTLTATNQHFVAGTANIQFGKTTLDDDGSRRTMTVSGVTNYPGFIQNGSSGGNGNNSVSIYNIIVNSSSSTLAVGGGWIGHEYFSRGATNNIIVNCSSDGAISNSGGGITGQFTCLNGGSAVIRGCTSSGNTTFNSGGIIGATCCTNSGSLLTIDRCSTSGSISLNAGGITGNSCGINGGTVNISNSYSTGSIGGSGGGILGITNGSNGTVSATNCYSTGSIGSGAGGIFAVNAGVAGGSATATNCFSTGAISGGGGIFGSGYSNAFAYNCYSSGAGSGGTYGGIWYNSSSDVIAGLGSNNYAEANHSSSGWNTTNANTALLGEPTTSNYGTTWSSLGLGQPYVLSLSGYTPYSLSLIETATSSVEAGKSTSAPVVPGYGSFALLGINTGLPSAVPEITINSTTGVISVDSALKAGVFTLYIYSSINPYNVTTYTLNVSDAPATVLTPCCALPMNLPNFSYTYRYDVVTGNAVLADTYRRTAYPDYSFYYARKMAAASKR